MTGDSFMPKVRCIMLKVLFYSPLYFQNLDGFKRCKN